MSVPWEKKSFRYRGKRRQGELAAWSHSFSFDQKKKKGGDVTGPSKGMRVGRGGKMIPEGDGKKNMKGLQKRRGRPKIR